MSLNYFIFDGESSLDYGVYIGGQDTYNAPQRDITKVSIPGRNGDLIQDNGRFLNVQVPYTIVVMDEFLDKTDAIKAWLLSKKGYVRLEDTYHPGTYRMARVSGGIDFSTSAFNKTGKTKVIFDCKPQRFLKSGEEPFDVGVWGETETASGSVATFEYPTANGACKSLTAAISPTQNLGGYDAPWPPGGGKNKVQIASMNATTAAEVTFTPAADGSVALSGTSSSSSTRNYGHVVLPAGTYIVSGIPDNASTSVRDTAISIRNGQYTGSVIGIIYSNTDRTFTLELEEETDIYLRLYVYSAGGDVTGYVFKPMIRLATETDPTWTPYSNICPITGETGATVYQKGKNLLNHVNGDITSNGITFTRANDGVTINGTATSNASVQLFYGKLPAGTYTLNGISGASNSTFRSGIQIGNAGTVYNGQDKHTFTLAKTTNVIVRLYAYAANGKFTNLKVQYQLEVGETVTNYEPKLTSTLTYPITWQTSAGTVYGGTVDVVSGVLTVTHGNIASYDGETIGEPWISSLDGYLPGATPTTGAQVVYPLATPQTIQLEPQQIKTLLGINNVWADIGDVTVEYGENPGAVENPTRFASNPQVHVEGNGAGTVSIGNGIVQISDISGYVDIDCENKIIYKGVESKNDTVVLPGHRFPELEPGINNISYSGGVSAVTVKGNWWTI